jgi:hypothetical protein
MQIKARTGDVNASIVTRSNFGFKWRDGYTRYDLIIPVPGSYRPVKKDGNPADKTVCGRFLFPAKYCPFCGEEIPDHLNENENTWRKMSEAMKILVSFRKYVSYIAREGRGVGRKKPAFFTGNGKKLKDVLHTNCLEEKHFYQITLISENGDKTDMEQYTKDFMKSLEQGEGREFKWAAAVHYDTEHPHAHILIRGVDETGQETAFSPETIKQDMHGQAFRLATIEPGNWTET